MNRMLRFTFSPNIDLHEVENTLHLAVFAVEGLVGRVRVGLDTDCLVDEPGRSILIDEATFAGWLIARVFAALLAREFGEKAFNASRLRHPRVHNHAIQVEEVVA